MPYQPADAESAAPTTKAAAVRTPWLASASSSWAMLKSTRRMMDMAATKRASHLYSSCKKALAPSWI